jgi:hypothetical protein
VKSGARYNAAAGGTLGALRVERIHSDDRIQNMAPLALATTRDVFQAANQVPRRIFSCIQRCRKKMVYMECVIMSMFVASWYTVALPGTHVTWIHWRIFTEH